MSLTCLKVNFSLGLNPPPNVWLFVMYPSSWCLQSAWSHVIFSLLILQASNSATPYLFLSSFIFTSFHSSPFPFLQTFLPQIESFKLNTHSNMDNVAWLLPGQPFWTAKISTANRLNTIIHDSNHHHRCWLTSCSFFSLSVPWCSSGHLPTPYWIRVRALKGILTFLPPPSSQKPHFTCNLSLQMHTSSWAAFDSCFSPPSCIC